MERARKPHYLTDLPRSGIPESFAVYGVASRPETDKEGVPRMVGEWWHGMLFRQTPDDLPGRYDLAEESGGPMGESWHQWTRGLLQPKKRLDVWSIHTAATLAMLGFWEELESGRWMLRERMVRTVKGKEVVKEWNGLAVVSDPPTIVVARPKNHPGTVRLLDVRNLGVASVMDLPGIGFDSLGDGVSYDKNHALANVMASDIAQAVAAYLKSWIHTVSEQRLGEFKVTAASQAWTAFRHRFMAGPIICHCRPEVESLEAESYHNGRTEAFRMGRVAGPIFQVDVNSCYPSVVLDQPLPVRQVKLYEDGNDRFLSLMGKGYEIIGQVEIESSHPCYPVQKGERTIFPIGRFKTTLPGPEIRLAYKRGDLHRVGKLAVYERSACLRPFVQWCLDFRAASRGRADSVGADVAKQMANAFIGMFAKRTKSWETLPGHKPEKAYADRYDYDPATKLLTHFRTIAYMVQREVVSGPHADAVVAISSTVTSWARVKLWELIEAAGRENVVYCSTDSLLVNHDGYDRLGNYGIYGDKVAGKLKLVNVSDWATIYGVGHYETGDGRKASGVPADAIGSHESGFVWDSFEKPKGALSRGQRPEARLLPRKAIYGTNYLHGEVDQYGNVRPITLEEW